MQLAVREVFVSDLSGAEIVNGSAAKITIHLASSPSKVYVLDAREDEISELLGKATAKSKRGRKPKAK
jgi:hypothetical protein